MQTLQIPTKAPTSPELRSYEDPFLKTRDIGFVQCRLTPQTIAHRDDPEYTLAEFTVGVCTGLHRGHIAEIVHAVDWFNNKSCSTATCSCDAVLIVNWKDGVETHFGKLSLQAAINLAAYGNPAHREEVVSYIAAHS